MARVDGLKQLTKELKIDNNTVICQIAESRDDKTHVRIVTPEMSCVKQLVVTSTKTFGYELTCGGLCGSGMSNLNEGKVVDEVDLGNDEIISIQFLKAGITGQLCDFGTIVLQEPLRYSTVEFFWPADAPGDRLDK